jgi:hypothetical protein
VYAGCLRTTHVCPWGRKQSAHVHTRLCPRQPAYTLNNIEKMKMQELTLPMNLSCNRMYVHWREREHEDIDILVDEDPAAMAALKQCGLWKFFWCPFMRAQPRLLNALVDYWHPDAEAFMLEGQSLTPMTEDIYFLTGLSRRGEPVNLHSFPPGPHNITELIRMHCEADTEKVGSQVPIHKITNLSLKVIVLLIGWITGSAALHQASRVHMYCAVQCLNARVFDWSMTMLDCMKRQLTECRGWSNKNFGFGTILCSFFFERVPSLSP